MRRQSWKGEERKKRHKPVVTTSLTEVSPAPEELPDEIEPADFFDPEEFGIRRRNLKSLEP